MLALVVLAGPVAAIAVLLVVRRRSPRPRSPRTDRVVAVTCAVVAAVLLAAWPSTALRNWLGYVDPDQCLGKDKPPAPAPEGAVDIEALKAQVRQRRLDVGPTLGFEAVETRQLSRVTGPGSPGRTSARWNVGGTDLGHPVVLEGRLGLIFGDTFAVPNASGPGWRSNVLGWVEETGGDQLMVTEMHEAPTGQAGELLGSLKINGWEQTVIPTDAIAIDGDIVMHYMSIACWGTHGRWAVRHSGLAVSTDGGRSFDRLLGETWPARSGFAQVAFVREGDHVYAFGIPEGRDGAIRLARVHHDRVLDKAAWTYWDGETWQPDERAAVQLVAPPAGELSVSYNQHFDQWLMLYLDESRGGIVMRAADRLTGPWSRARLVASATQFPSLYAPYLLPESGQGATIRFTMSRFDIYNVVLMESRLVPRPQVVPRPPS